MFHFPYPPTNGSLMASAHQVWEFARAGLGDHDGFAIVLKVFLDESGIHDGSPVVTVAAYLGRPRDWREWTKRWNVAKRPIDVFHASDAQALKGEFDGWSETRRDDLVKRVLGVTADSGLPGIVIGINLNHFDEALSGEADLRKFFGTPYTACFHWVVQSLMYLQFRTDNRERVMFVHENNDFHGDAMESFNYMKDHVNPGGVAMSMMFVSKADFPPLQAADILAYEGNRRMRDPDRPERRPWQVLNPDNRIIASHYGRDNMKDLVANLRRVRDGLPIQHNPEKNWLRVLMGERINALSPGVLAR